MADASERREHQVARLKDRFLRRGNPRLLMMGVLFLTGLAGFLASAAMREMGMARQMGLRYVLAVGVAYLTFLATLSLWLFLTRRRRQRTGPIVEGDDVVNAVYLADTMQPMPVIAHPEDLESIGDLKLGELADGDGEGVAIIVVLLLVVAVLAALFAGVWVLMEAPLLLAEIFVDGALVAGMARRLRRVEPDRHWIVTAIRRRRTWVPFLIAAIAFAFVGGSLQYFVPEATTMLEALTLAWAQG